MAADEKDLPTPQQIDAMLAFLPIFAREGFVASEWTEEPGQWSYFEDTRETQEFRSTIHSSGFYCPFDWATWQEEAARYVNEPERLAGADLVTIRKLFTLHLRKDRYVEGHFAAMIECGHVVTVLRRLAELREGG